MEENNLDSGIKALVLDIDGVVTDGTVNVSGPPVKRVFLRDLDALTRARKAGLIIAFLTGEPESEAIPVIERCGGGEALCNRKDKEAGIRELSGKLGIQLSRVCYIGDARRDIPALRISGLGLCPSDGDRLAREAAHRVLASPGGKGAVEEAVDILLGMEAINND